MAPNNGPGHPCISFLKGHGRRQGEAFLIKASWEGAMRTDPPTVTSVTCAQTLAIALCNCQAALYKETWRHVGLSFKRMLFFNVFYVFY